MQFQLDDLKEYFAKFKEQAAILLDIKGQKERAPVAIDIGQEFVKLLKINRTETPYRVENFAIAPASVVIGSATKDPAHDYAELAAVIKSMLQQAGVTSKEVALAIPRSIAILKSITVDRRLSPDDLESRAWIEAGHHFPDLIGEIYLDFFITDTNQEDPSRLDMTLVACRKAQIQPYLEIIRLAGLQAKIVDVDCYALERALPLVTSSFSNDDPIAILSLNSNTSSLVVVQAGKLIYANDQGYDGQRLMSQTNSFLKNKQVDNAEAAETVVQVAEYQEILKNNLISHLHHIMHFFAAARPNLNIKKLIIAGDCARVPGLVSFIAHETVTETEIADLLSHLALSPGINADEFKRYAPGLVLCCGLALSQLEY